MSLTREQSLLDGIALCETERSRIIKRIREYCAEETRLLGLAVKALEKMQNDDGVSAAPLAFAAGVKEKIREFLETCEKESNNEMRIALERALPLLSLLTVQQVIEGGDAAIQAAGLDPYCINEGLAQGNEKISTDFVEAALDT